eukprot:gene12734-13947_t
MAFLFQHKRRPFKEDVTSNQSEDDRSHSLEKRSQSLHSSDDEDLLEFNPIARSSSTQTKKRGRKPALIPHSSKVQKINPSQSATVSVIEIDEEEKDSRKNEEEEEKEDKDDEIEEIPLTRRSSSRLSKKSSSVTSSQSNKSVRSKAASSVREVIDILDEDTEPLPSSSDTNLIEEEEEDDVARSMRALRSKLMSAKQSLDQATSLPLTTSTSTTHTTTAPSSSSITALPNDDSALLSRYPSIQRSYSIPKVLSASERTELMRKTSVKSSLLQEIEEEKEEVEEKDSSAYITVKTRLKGKEDKQWKINVSDNFSELQGKIEEAYELTSQPFSLIFDGEAIDIEGMTSEELGLEDGDLIDIKIHDQSQTKQTKPTKKRK